ncbi:MAG: aldehyde dehydrogenase family protein [Microthrixaceae bacterium]
MATQTGQSPKSTGIADRYDLVVAGELREGGDGSTIGLVEPATGEHLTSVAQATESDVEAALSAATIEFESGSWRRASATDRGRVLLRVAHLLRERAEQFALAEVRGAGHPIGNARWEAGTAADVFEYFAGAANKHYGDVIPVQDAGVDLAVREPVGVCALVVPWNFPLLITTWKVAPALACGNPVVIKPASLTPITALLLAEVLLEAGVPPGAVSVLPGPGRSVGEKLVCDPRVAKISFTGETSTGARILAQSAHNVPRVSLELGGKSACVVFEDSDLERAIAATPMSVFDNTGQDCCARSRFLVQRSIYDEFVAGFVEATSQLVVGDPLQEGTQLGPMVSEAQRGVALDYLGIGDAEGARRVCGGESSGPGWYLSPAVLADVDNDMRVAREEIFGPVAAIIPFDDEAEAVRLANDSPYGLSGTVWTNDLGRALRVTRAIRTGVISVNSSRSVRTEAPFGGFKQSGLGRELGMAAMSHYTETKNIFLSEE